MENLEKFVMLIILLSNIFKLCPCNLGDSKRKRWIWIWVGNKLYRWQLTDLYFVKYRSPKAFIRRQIFTVTTSDKISLINQGSFKSPPKRTHQRLESLCNKKRIRGLVIHLSTIWFVSYDCINLAQNLQRKLFK